MILRLPLTLSKNLNLVTLCGREHRLSYLVSKKGLFPSFFSRCFSDSVNTKVESRSDDSQPDLDSKWMSKSTKDSKSPRPSPPFQLDSTPEELTEEQQLQKQEIIRELTKKLSGPLADENGNVPTGDQRPIAIEVDGPSHFYSNSTKYTAYTKLKHRLLTRMGYKVLHVPFFEWRRLRGAREREEYMREKLKEEPTEWLDPEDEEFYNKRIESLNKQRDDALNSLNLTSN
ncbi:hypothetical protein MACK_003093 [Theileria orientalis]|uniref:RAP domain-containing protein n=1 Tax=Theileria orientalis TaxID=68886 RepID=A0A976QVY3_THEOR|nr:hypothetical protein MACK_003093 [Theileria orientalis]